MATSSPTAATTSVPTITPTKNQEEVVEEEEEEEPCIFLGSLNCELVGIRYYNGVAHPGEYVKLSREPNNPYDPNAIRVDNLGGEKVGHVKRTVATALAPLMDRMPHIVIDATIPYPGNTFTLPCLVEFQGTCDADVQAVATMLKKAGKPKAAPKAYRHTTNKRGGVPVTPDVQVAKKKMDWESAQKDLDEMFDKLTGEQLKNLPEIDMPDSLTGHLFDHQVQGIKWLYGRETGNKPVPFYRVVKEGGKQVWLSDITNSSQPNQPAPVKGSILADTMGLGKTLQAIGLILANPPSKTAAHKTTLIICPVSVMPNWLQQIEQHVKKDTLKVAMYHGNDRFKHLANLAEIDVLIAPYGTISADFGAQFPKADKKGTVRKTKKHKGASIFAETFHRIIMDEAHIVRNTKSRTFAGCAKLQATYRLCLTGTPLQNKPDDLLSLFHFLHVEPLGDKDIFRRAVTQPIMSGNDVGLARLRTMMAHVSLRRSKAMVNLQLPTKTVELRAVEFPADGPHKKVHDILFESAQSAFRATLANGDDGALKNYMMILETLTRIRQACVSGSLVPKQRLECAEKVLQLVKDKKGELTAEEGKQLLEKLKGAFEAEADEAVECAVCLNEMDESAAVILKKCSHVFCEPCLSQVITQCNGICPLCRQTFTKTDMVKKCAATAAASDNKEAVVPMSETLDDLGPSPKLQALAQAIEEMKADEKGVIFSQFTKFLDVLEPFLTSKGMTFTRIDGKKTATQRIKAMKEFAQDDGPRFILCSLHAAGTGITLNRANHCFLMDTWWNQAVELQAMDRVHRIGQTRDVRVIRFVMVGTLEERMMDLQEAKAALGKGAMQKLDPEEMRKARIGDLKNLFSID